MKKFNSDYYFHLLFKLKNIVLIIGLISFAIACGSALYIPNESNTASNSNINELQEGRKLYIKNCSSCHSLVLPEKHNAEQWQVWMNKMDSKVKITTEEKRLILKYLSKGKE